MTRKPTIAPLLAATLTLALAQAAQAQTLDTTSTSTGTTAATIDSSSTLQSVSIDPNVTALRQATNTFTRMFRNLPPFALQSDSVRTAMKQLGAAGGVLDAKDVLTDPIQSITNPAVFSPNNADNPNMTAGVTFFGQFLDHDITLDKNSPLNRNASPGRTINFRTAAFDLDSVYGNGPAGSPELYHTVNGRIKFKLERIPGAEAVSRNGAPRYDLPRTADGFAIVAEGRNDENAILSQFQVAMLRFHNAVTDHLARQPGNAGAKPAALFAAARRYVTWHYQWIVVNEFLPQTIGQDRVNNILTNGTRFFNAQDPVNQYLAADGRRNILLPIEFSVAAYRFGHSQVRPSYRLNFGPTGGAPFFAFIFDDNLDPTDPDPADLRGAKRAPRRFVDWQTFFNFGDGNFRANKRIDSHLSTPLMILPGAKAPSPGLPADGLQSLASRNLVRHVNFGLPSGQAIATRMGVTALTPAELPELASYVVDGGVRLDQSTPLWYYILKEAEVKESGLRMGDVGGNIVGEVFVSLLKADPASYLSVRPGWKPTLPSATPGTFKLTDLLTFAGVVPPL
ncbi:heme peroxidase family protein [uncultured Aquabacterium sp.]|uniref:peroxidase family protein n=1 Tax=uncultured Aquabacterium sp. TaxID=158753 RepID=UPI0030CDE661|tara:strand:+ start:2326 stop:4023 length:1698 start_codon:yes stop_codon:yes gene_type:complete